MKLYTEEKLRGSMLSMKTYIEVYDKNVIDKIVENHIKALNPIQLPSDDEIKESMGHYDESDTDDEAFLAGAIWMRDKIKGGEQ